MLSDYKYNSKSLNHLHNYKTFKTFGDCNILTAISESVKHECGRHNKQVEENREYLKLLVNVVLYLSKLELSLRVHFEGKDSLNKGNYRQLLDYFY